MGVATSIIAGSLVTMGVASAAAANKALNPKHAETQVEEQPIDTRDYEAEERERQRLADEESAQEAKRAAEEAEKARLEQQREDFRQSEFEKPRELTFGGTLSSGLMQ